MHASASSMGLARPKPSISSSVNVRKIIVVVIGFEVVAAAAKKGVLNDNVVFFSIFHLPGTSIFANKLSFRSLRATLNTNLQAPVRLLPVTSNCMNVWERIMYYAWRCSSVV